MKQAPWAYWQLWSEHQVELPLSAVFPSFLLHTLLHPVGTAVSKPPNCSLHRQADLKRAMAACMEQKEGSRNPSNNTKVSGAQIKTITWETHFIVVYAQKSLHGGWVLA